MNNLKLRRMTLGMTQLELARKGGVAEQTITKIETGRMLAPKSLRQKLAQALGVAESELFAQELLTNVKKVRGGARHE